MGLSIFEMAMLYYPNQWDKDRIDNLHNLGRLTDEQYEKVLAKEQAKQDGSDATY